MRRFPEDIEPAFVPLCLQSVNEIYEDGLDTASTGDDRAIECDSQVLVLQVVISLF
jgi:hypothetical protein